MFKKKLIQRKLLSVSLAALFAVGVGAPLAHANEKEAVAKSGTTVYLTVEKSVLGQGLIQAPVKVEIPDSVQNPTIYDALKTQFGEGQDGMKHAGSQYGAYISAFADKNETLYNTSNYKYKDNLPKVCWETNGNQQVNTNPTDKFLSEKEYNGAAGWMITLNDQLENVSAGSTVRDGDVIRCQFSLAAGCDLGYNGWIPTGEDMPYGYYNWQEHAAFFNGRADKSELIRKMAESKTSSMAYQKAKVVLNNLEVTQSDVKEAIARF